MSDQSSSDLETKVDAKVDLESRAESGAESMAESGVENKVELKVESRVTSKTDLKSRVEPAAATELEVSGLLAKLAQSSPECLNKVVVETSAATAVQTSTAAAVETASRPAWAKVRQEMFYFASGQWDKVMPQVWT